jgi:DNA-binding beta-propeller fold protein YncE
MHALSLSRRRLLLGGLAFGVGLAGCATDAPPTMSAPPPAFPPPPAPPRYLWERTLRSSADVQADDGEASLRRFVTGEVRSGAGLAKPYGVAVQRGRLYVGDTVLRHVLMFDLVEGRFERLGAEEPGALQMPFGLALDPAGQLHVLDGARKLVQVYDAAGQALRTFGPFDHWSRPAGLALDSTRGRLYVADAGGVGSERHVVHVLDLHSGAALPDIGRRGDQPGEFNLPRDVAVAPDGTLYVVDSGNFRIQSFEPDGRHRQVFGAIGRRSGQFSRPKGIAVDGAGRVFVADAAFGNVQIFAPDGQLLLDVGWRGARDEPARFMLPAGVAVDQDGRIYLVDQFYRKVEVFRPA